MAPSEPQLSSQTTTSIPTAQHIAYSNPRLPLLQTTSNYSQQNIDLSSSPTRSVDPCNPIHEEVEEEEDETSSEAANEPVTPIDAHNTQEFHDGSNDGSHGMLQNSDPSHPIFQQVNYKPPILTNTAATPPPGTKTTDPEPVPVKIEDTSSNTTTQQARPVSSREPSIRRGLSGFFRRSSSHFPNAAGLSLEGGISTENMSIPKEGRRLSIRRPSVTNTPNTTRSNTPPSPTASTHVSTSVPSEPTASQFLNASKQNRSSTGLHLRARLTGITFAQPERKKQSAYEHRKRANSVEFDAPVLKAGRHPTQLTHQPWALRPETGTGVKARRMSLNLPDDFTVDVAELNDEFEDQSKMIGRRGKSLGKGATSTVTIMYRKGCRGSTSDLFAVKRFVAKSKEDSVEEYEKKIKSEYSIAKSLHHPNVVETVRLCTHKGQWNHVMEYCSEGDLFSAVQRGYLKAREDGDRIVDRLCLFKQLMQGINYLHEHGIAHRDIKLENLLLTSQSKLKITDFGVSEIFCGIHPGLRAAGGECGKEMKEVRLCTPGICGSMPYIAPEVVSKQGEYDPRPLDVWSSAVVMIHVIFGGALWGKAEIDPVNETYVSIVNGWAKWEAKHAPGAKISADDYPHVRCLDNVVNPPALRRLLLTMLHPDPKKRATTAEVVNNRWLKNVDCCQMDSYDDPTHIIDASVSAYKPKVYGVAKQPNTKVVHHNHLPPNPSKTQMHRLIRLPGSTDM